MKRTILLIISAFFFYSNIFAKEYEVVNTAQYTINGVDEIQSNPVITMVKLQDMNFGEADENKPIQELGTDNRIYLKTILTMKNTGDKQFFFRNKYSNGVYANNTKFIVIDILTGEIIVLDSNPENRFESLSMTFKSNRSYFIFFEGSDLKNTINVKSTLFCLELVAKEDNAVLGCVENTLNINNPLTFGEQQENEKEQIFNKDGDLKILGNLDFQNILKEEVSFSIQLKDKVKFSSVVLKIADKEVELHYDQNLKKYFTKNLKLEGVHKVEVFIKNPEYIGDINDSEISLELNYNNLKHGEITNKIKYKEDKKILIEKISKTKSATIGDLVKYEVVIKNIMEEEKFENFTFIDYLPKGMTLVPESVKVSKSFLLKDVSNEDGNRVDIKVELQPEFKVSNKEDKIESITYMARINVNANDGKNINRVNLVGKTSLGQTFDSNIATAEVNIDKDNFYDKGIIFGRVYLDLDDDGLYKYDKDIPVPGVKIFLENGDFAISDRYGKYSIYGVEAVTHIAKIFRHTLPLGLKTKKITNQQSESGESKFADLKKAQLDRNDFALTLDGTRDLEFIKKILEKRYETLAEDSYELDRAIEGKFLEAKTSLSTSKQELSGEKGVINNGKELDIESIRNIILYQNITIEEKNVEKRKTLVEEWNLIPDYRLEEDLNTFNNDLDFLNVKDGAIVPEFMSFQVKGPGEGILKIFTNDVEVSPENVSLTAKVATTNVFFLEYASVKLEPGKTKLRVAYHDMFGVERGRKEIEVFVRGGYEKVLVEVKDSIDNNSLKKIVVKGVDNYDHSITQSLTINIEANKGRFVTPDGMTESSATFVTNIDGYGEIGYKPNPGKNKVQFKISAEGKDAEVTLEIEGTETDFFMNGIVEGRYNFSKNRDLNFYFEKEVDSYKDKLFYRAAIYGEGSVKNVGYLTLTYDTHKDEEDKFFSYKDPDDYYPLFGDNSTKGYVGKSADNLFLKIDRDRSYLLYGDYKTGELFTQNLRLGKFNRTLTGGVVKYEDDRFEVITFIAETSNVKYTEELRGEGVSGPYKLKHRDIVPGSEVVTLLVEDKATGIVLEEKKLSSGTDYKLEYDFGRLYFSEPLPSLDLNFNPIKIKVTYEVEASDGEKKLVFGGEANYKLNDKAKIGVTHFEDSHDKGGSEISTVHAVYEGDEFKLVAEQSFTTDEFEETGDATSILAKYEKDKIKTEFIYEKSSTGYSNSDSSLDGGINRGKIIAEYSFESAGKLKLNSTLEERTPAEGYPETRMDSYLGYETDWIKSFKYELGLRQYIKDSEIETEQVYSFGGKITWQGLEDNKLKLFLEYEQGLEDAEQRRMALGADYKVFEQTSVYVRHELISNLGDYYYLDGEESSNRTVVGVKTTVSENEIYSEYREKNTDEEVLPEIAYGIKRSFKPLENLELFGTFEKVSELTKDREDETNITVGYDYTSEKIGRFRGEFEVEIEDEFSFLNKLSYGKQLSQSAYFITKNRYYIEGDEEENRFVVGFAFRDAKDNSYHSMNKYELNYSKNIVEDNYKKLTHILRSTHNFQDDLDFEKTITFAVKNSDINYEGVQSNYFSYLLAGNLSYDIYENWTTGVNLALLFDNEDNLDYGLGLELGYLFKSNLWLSIGYNFVGFKDKDFDPTSEFDKGLYLRFRINIGDIFDRVKESSDK